MSAAGQRSVAIIGAGLTGPLLGLMLARRGFAVTVFERRGDPRRSTVGAGRSINLALAARGMRPLARAGVLQQVEPFLLPMCGRMVHELSTAPVLQRYGQRSQEVIYSVERAALNRVLIEAAERAGVTLRFEHRCLGLHGQALRCLDERTGDTFDLECETAIAADGAGSPTRASLERSGACTVQIEPLGHDYKEMTLPALTGGTPALDPAALHIWPRGGFMLIALPNPDGTFTLTLFLARSGEQSFATLSDDASLERFFAAQFPDLAAYHAGLCADFRRNPQGQLATVHARGWHLGGRVLLLGDAAHAIVPFHGQGMNAGFEDCALLDELLDAGGDWAELYARFEEARRPSTEAIAHMALENYREMRDQVRDRKFQRLKRLAFELEQRFPERFIPRYSMVMFHPEISYLQALRRGEVQAGILERLDQERTADGGLDVALAEALVREHLPPLGSRDPAERTG
ncbi:MAG: FAD-dependent oxidoreductase [Steroidobacteraceae bacterium]